MIQIFSINIYILFAYQYGYQNTSIININISLVHIFKVHKCICLKFLIIYVLSEVCVAFIVSVCVAVLLITKLAHVYSVVHCIILFLPLKPFFCFHQPFSHWCCSPCHLTFLSLLMVVAVGETIDSITSHGSSF